MAWCFGCDRWADAAAVELASLVLLLPLPLKLCNRSRDTWGDNCDYWKDDSVNEEKPMQGFLSYPSVLER